MQPVQLTLFEKYLETASRQEMRTQIREISIIETNGEKQYMIRPWFPMEFSYGTIYWTDTTVEFPKMAAYRKQKLEKSMRFRMDPQEGKADIRERKSGLYLQIKIEIPDTL